MNTLERHMTLKQLISKRKIRTQEELARLLRQSGFSVTQATLSRNRQELRIVRVHSPSGPNYAISPEKEELRLQAFPALEIETIEHHETHIVIKTLPGRAQGVAEIIDALHHPDVLGTIAGDHTIFVSPRSAKRIPASWKRFGS